MPHNKQLQTMLRALPIEDRLTELVVSIMQENPHGLAVSLRMARVTGKLSEDLSTEHRFAVASRLRDVADQLERRRATVAV